MPAPRRFLLLPPHHPSPRRKPRSAPQPSNHLRTALAGRPQRHPALHRRSSSPHSHQRYRPAPGRPAPLRPPDRQPQPSQTPAGSQICTRNRNGGRNHARSHPRPTRSQNRSGKSRLQHSPRSPRYDRRDPVRRIRYAMRDGHTSTIHRTRNTLRTSSDRSHRKSRHREHASLFLHPTPNKRHLGRRRRLHRTTKASS